MIKNQVYDYGLGAREMKFFAQCFGLFNIFSVQELKFQDDLHNDHTRFM